MPLLIDTPEVLCVSQVAERYRGEGNPTGITRDCQPKTRGELHVGAKSPNWRSMAVRRIRLLGDPILRVRCERVQNPKSAATRLLADDLRDTLRVAKEKHKMGRALAAPQIGAPVRIVFVAIDKQRWTMINPEITDVGPDDFLVWDDCFSFPNLYVRVSRAHQITV